MLTRGERNNSWVINWHSPLVTGTGVTDYEKCKMFELNDRISSNVHVYRVLNAQIRIYEFGVTVHGTPCIWNSILQDDHAIASRSSLYSHIKICITNIYTYILQTKLFHERGNAILFSIDFKGYLKLQQYSSARIRDFWSVFRYHFPVQPRLIEPATSGIVAPSVPRFRLR